MNTRYYFERDVRTAGWNRLSTDDVFAPMPGRRSVVVGSVIWSLYDLDFLAQLASKRARSDTDIHIFSLDDVRSEDDLRRFMPGVRLPTKTPIVAEYVGSALQRCEEGPGVATLLDGL